jgi:hypothetical protein
MAETRTLLAALAGLGLLAATPGNSGEAQDRLFAVGVLDEVATGQRLVFGHARTGSFDAGRLPRVEDSAIEVEIAAREGGGREALVTLAETGGRKPLPPLPAGAGHPLLLVFLEQTVRDVAALTGGSPFYIRNRMREALGAQETTERVEFEAGGGPVTAERLSFRPFAHDPNRERLGPFADLEIAVVVNDEVPGGFAAFELTTGPAPDGAPLLVETMTFERLEED